MPNPFVPVTPTPDQHALMAGLRRQFHSLYENVAACVPDGPYREKALNDLEQASAWANKGITHSEKE